MILNAVVTQHGVMVFPKYGVKISGWSKIYIDNFTFDTIWKGWDKGKYTLNIPSDNLSVCDLTNFKDYFEGKENFRTTNELVVLIKYFKVNADRFLYVFAEDIERQFARDYKMSDSNNQDDQIDLLINKKEGLSDKEKATIKKNMKNDLLTLECEKHASCAINIQPILKGLSSKMMDDLINLLIDPVLAYAAIIFDDDLRFLDHYCEEAKDERELTDTCYICYNSYDQDCRKKVNIPSCAGHFVCLDCFMKIQTGQCPFCRAEFLSPYHRIPYYSDSDYDSEAEVDYYRFT